METIQTLRQCLEEVKRRGVQLRVAEVLYWLVGVYSDPISAQQAIDLVNQAGLGEKPALIEERHTNKVAVQHQGFEAEKALMQTLPARIIAIGPGSSQEHAHHPVLFVLDSDTKKTC